MLVFTPQSVLAEGQRKVTVTQVSAQNLQPWCQVFFLDVMTNLNSDLFSSLISSCVRAHGSGVTAIWLAFPQNTNYSEREWGKLINQGGLEWSLECCSWAVKPCITEKHLAQRLKRLYGPPQSDVLKFQSGTRQRPRSQLTTSIPHFIHLSRTWATSPTQAAEASVLLCLQWLFKHFAHTLAEWRTSSSYHADELSQRHL